MFSMISEYGEMVRILSQLGKFQEEQERVKD
jgi:hypothetical protein